MFASASKAPPGRDTAYVPLPDSMMTRLLDSVGEAVIATSAEGRITYWNRAAQDLYGWSAEEVLGRDILEIIAAPASAQEASSSMEALAAGASFRAEFPVRRKDGTLFPALVTSTPVLDDQGKLVAIIGVSSDLSEIKRAQELARSQKAILEAQVDASPNAVVVTIDDVVRAANSRFYALWGVSADEALGERCLNLVDRVAPLTCDPEDFVAHAPARLNHRGPHLYEFTLRDGRSIRSYVTDVAGEDGVPIGKVIFYSDITAEVTARRALEQRFRQQQFLARLGELALGGCSIPELAQIASDSLAVVLQADQSAVVQVAQDDASVLVLAGTGWNPGVVGTPRRFDADGMAAAVMRRSGPLIIEDFDKDDRFSPHPVLKEHAVHSGVAVAIPGRRAPFGVVAAFSTTSRTFAIDEQELIRAVAGIIGMAVERARIEQELKESERRLTSLVENVPDGVVVMDASGRVVLANQALARLMNVDAPAELVGRSIPELLPTELVPLGEQLLRRTLTEGRVGPVVVPAAVEAHGCREITAVPFELGEHPAMLAVVRDVTQQKQLEARLMVSDRMASVGTLAAGVAHELNNPLAFVLSNLRFVSDELKELQQALLEVDDPRLAPQLARLAELENALDDATEGADRMRIIVRDLMSFSRVDEDTRTAVDLTRVFESAIQMTWNEIRHRAQLVRSFTAVPPVLANEARLGQVFINLLVNAAQALPEGDAQAHRIELTMETDSDGWAQVSVRDTGSGIAPENLKRIFDPFFTTKPVGVGTGLGLTVCHGIVTKLGGTIDVDSRVGKGTTFTLRLPPAERRTSPEAPATMTVGPEPRGRILAIDDEKLLLSTFTRALGRHHDVYTTGSVGEALARLRAGERFDVIFCDMMMPDSSGMDFHDAVGREFPELLPSIVYMTGGAFTSRAREFLDQVPNARLQKPFDTAAVRALVRSRLEDDQRGS